MISKIKNKKLHEIEQANIKKNGDVLYNNTLYPIPRVYMSNLVGFFFLIRFVQGITPKTFRRNMNSCDARIIGEIYLRVHSKSIRLTKIKQLA